MTQRVDDVVTAARIAAAHWSLGGCGLLLANPPPESIDVDDLIEEAVAEAAAHGVTGQAVTPFVLARLHERSDGRTREVNRALARRERAARRRGVGSVGRACEPVRRRPRPSAEHRELRARAPVAAGATGVPPQDHRRPPARRWRGGHRRGRDLPRRGARPPPGARAGPALAGSWTLHSFSEHLATLPLFDAEPAQHAYYDYRRWGFESAALDLALRQAGTSLGAALGREARPVSRSSCRRARRSALDGAVPRVAGSLPRSAVQARREPGLDGGARSPSSRRPAPSTRSTSRASTVARPSTRLPTRSSIAVSPRACPTPGSRTRPHGRDRSRARAAPRSRDLGRDHPLGRGHRGAALDAAHRQRQAVTVRLGRAPLRGLRLLRGATASARTAVGSGSSAPAADTSSSSPR